MTNFLEDASFGLVLKQLGKQDMSLLKLQDFMKKKSLDSLYRLTRNKEESSKTTQRIARRTAHMRNVFRKTIATALNKEFRFDVEDIAGFMRSARSDKEIDVRWSVLASQLRQADDKLEDWFVRLLLVPLYDRVSGVILVKPPLRKLVYFEREFEFKLIHRVPTVADWQEMICRLHLSATSDEDDMLDDLTNLVWFYICVFLLKFVFVS